MGSSSAPSVAILMCTYNGAKYIKEQLDSFEAQTHENWRLVVSDDGSTDETIDILHDYQHRWGEDRLIIQSGPKRGFAANFLTLASDALIQADYYAFSDQDDVWLPKKLEAAVDFLSSVYPLVPQVYGGRTIYVDESLNEIGRSQVFAYPPSFRNALVQSIVGGNTIVFNHSTKTLFEKVGVLEIVSHDWWTYMLVEGVGGYVHFDPEPYILYRQHPGALVGANTDLRAMWIRFCMLIQGKFKVWNTTNANALLKIRHLLNKRNVDIIEEFFRLRDSGFVARIRMLNVCGLFRQGWRGNASLLLAVILKKI